MMDKKPLRILSLGGGVQSSTIALMIGCPYHSDKEWNTIKKSKQDWENVVHMDAVIRNTGRNMREEQYMHRSLMPIADIDFSAIDLQDDLWGNECTGMCGV